MTQFSVKSFLSREREFAGFLRDMHKGRPWFTNYASMALEAAANNRALDEHAGDFHGFTYLRKLHGKGALPYAMGEITICDCGKPCKVNECQVQPERHGVLPADWVYIGNDDLFETWYDSDVDGQACEACKEET